MLLPHQPPQCHVLPLACTSTHFGNQTLHADQKIYRGRSGKLRSKFKSRDIVQMLDLRDTSQIIEAAAAEPLTALFQWCLPAFRSLMLDLQHNIEPPA